ncbi:MAG: alpha-ketoacid dehydrogenase subunit beta [Lachnospiraceae bacterium]|nr:alpha-ketoacid dehydrogenase subunit beta [Lachnospiraceae bacterium]
MSIKTYREAIHDALEEEMDRDADVILMGEDIGVYGGGFGATAGLLKKYGKSRVLDTPISETAFVGTAIGAAVTGMRPVVELMFSDFMSVCWDQIMNEAAKMHFMYAGSLKVPLVIRTAAGGGTGAAAQHSQSLEAMYCHVPGLKVVIPSTPYDAKGLMKSSIRDDNPVIVLEQKLLYNTKGPVPDGEYTIPLGKADVKRDGTDVTLITYGRMVQMCLNVAEWLALDGISAEVLDLRTLSPLDTDAINASVAKTGRAVVVHESVRFGGFGGEIVSSIMEGEAFRFLKSPVKRVGGRFCPIPCSPELEKNVFPTPERIEAAVREML